MKKCFSCGVTTGLKRMWYDECSDEVVVAGKFYGCTCKKCYLELGCPEEHGIIRDCIESGRCPDSQKYKSNIENWDRLDYHYKPKKGVILDTR